MKYGRELEVAIVEFIANNEEPGEGLMGYEVTSMFARFPGDHRTVEQALARLVKSGELIVNRDRDADGLPTYLLPQT